MATNKSTYLILVYLLSVFSATAQSFKLSGYVVDSISQQPIPFANIYEVKNKKGVSSDLQGYFELTLKKPNKLIVEISHIEYKKKIGNLDISTDTLINIVLQPKTINLEDIVVIGSSATKNTSSIVFKQKQINIIPALGGEKDILKVLHYSPGVQGSNEGSIGFSVRGGGEDQNLYLIDNMPIYSPAHLLGFFSTFNPDIIQQTELVRAGMPANYGGKLSSLVNIKTIKPSFNELHGSYTLGLISAKAFAEIPIIKNKSGLMISARRSYFDVLTSIQAQLSDANDLTKIGFYDLNLKYEHSINKNNSISIEHMRSHDFYFSLFSNATSVFRDKSGIEWSGAASFVNYKHIASNNSTFSILAGINNYYHNYLNENYSATDKLENSYKKSSSIRDYLLKAESNYNIGTNLSLIIGGAYTFHAVEPLRMNVQNIELYNNKDDANETAIFAQMNLNLANNDIVCFGLRQNVYIHDSVSNFPLEPRISYIKELKGLGTLKSSISRNIQFIHRVEDFSTGLPTELWYVANKKLKYEENYQISFEINRKIKQWQLDVGAAIYYKWMNNLIDLGSYYADFPLPKTFDNIIVEGNGKGQAYGLELFCNKLKGNFKFTTSYLLSKSIRKFDNINDDNWYPLNTDRLHNFNTTISYKLNEKVLFSLAWIYSTGKPITVPEGRYYSINKEATTLYFIGNRNNYRLADYHRLDASIQFNKIRRKGTRTFELGLYNAYNRKNPYSIDFYDEMVYVNGLAKETGRVKIRQYSLFSIIPSISYIRQF